MTPFPSKTNATSGKPPVLTSQQCYANEENALKDPQNLNKLSQKDRDVLINYGGGFTDARLGPEYFSVDVGKTTAVMTAPEIASIRGNNKPVFGKNVDIPAGARVNALYSTDGIYLNKVDITWDGDGQYHDTILENMPMAGNVQTGIKNTLLAAYKNYCSGDQNIIHGDITIPSED